MALVTLDEVKTYLEISLGNTDHDVFLNGEILLMSSTIENYCGRKFNKTSYVQTFYRDNFPQDMDGFYLFSYHYPITTITSIKEISRFNGVDSEKILTSEDYRIHEPSGKLIRLYEGSRLNWFSDGAINFRIEAAFDAGYEDANIPLELKEVCYALIAEKYNKKINNVDVNFGSDVQRVSIPGTISIDFDYTLQNNERKSKFGMIIGNYANVLDFWRSERPLIGMIEEYYV